MKDFHKLRTILEFTYYWICFWIQSKFASLLFQIFNCHEHQTLQSDFLRFHEYWNVCFLVDQGFFYQLKYINI